MPSFNARTVAQLFKLELDSMFNAWEAGKPLRSGAPHASAILAPDSEWCLRRHVLTALYPEQVERPDVKPWSAHQNAVFLNGWVLHEKWQKLFNEHGQVVEVEHSHFDETRYLHFTPDAIVSFGGQRYVVEIKGYKSTTYEKLDEAGNPPAAAHVQANLYAHMLEIERGIILVENKDTQDYKVWAIQCDVELARPYLDRMYQVKGKVATRSTPARVCLSCTEHRAEKCPVRKLCFSGKLKEK
jgi:hypothetical protein